MRYSRNVFARERSPAATADAAPAAEAASPVRGGSGTWRNRGMEKTSHHAATITKDRRTASAGPASPNVPGDRVIATLRANRIPPPM